MHSNLIEIEELHKLTKAYMRTESKIENKESEKEGKSEAERYPIVFEVELYRGEISVSLEGVYMYVCLSV